MVNLPRIFQGSREVIPTRGGELEDSIANFSGSNYNLEKKVGKKNYGIKSLASGLIGGLGAIVLGAALMFAPAKAIAAANPAAVLANKLGLEYKIKTDKDGGQNGYVIIKQKDGTEKEIPAWKFYSGKEGDVCSFLGKKTESRKGGMYTPECAFCVEPENVKRDMAFVGVEKPIEDFATELISDFHDAVAGKDITDENVPYLINENNLPENNKTKRTTLDAVTTVVDLPSEFSWRNYAGPTKDQGACGACVPFAEMKVQESVLRIVLGHPNYKIDLAEEDVISCTGAITCAGGGYYGQALDIARTVGIREERCRPYNSGDGIEGPCEKKCSDENERKHFVKGWARITDPSKWTIDTSVRIKMIKEALIKYGPLAIIVDMGWTVGEDGLSRCNGVNFGRHEMVLVGCKDTGDVHTSYWETINSWGGDGRVRFAWDYLYGGIINMGQCKSDINIPIYTIVELSPEEKNSLANASACLQVLAGKNIPDGYTKTDLDATGDGRIYLDDANFFLQQAAELRGGFFTE